jgi:hypothetical protein
MNAYIFRHTLQLEERDAYGLAEANTKKVA